MRKTIIIVAGALACLSLAACGKSASDATADAPAPKKSLARSAPMYAGQDNIQSISAVSVEPGSDGSVILKVTGMAAGPGWTQAAFLPKIYAATPPDGVYDVDVVAQRPASGGDGAPTPVEVKGEWGKYKDGRVKGIRFFSKTNDMTAMLPAGAQPAAK